MTTQNSKRRHFSYLLLFVSSLLLISIGYNHPISLKASEPTSTPNLQRRYNQLLSRILQPLSNNAICAIPCFAGLIPGQSNVADVDQALQLLDPSDLLGYTNASSTSRSRNLEIGTQAARGYFRIGFVLENDILQQISIRLVQRDHWLPQNRFSPPQLFKELGTPDEIFISFSGPPAGYDMVFLYAKAGVLVQTYSVIKEEDRDGRNPIPLCFDWYKVGRYQEFSVLLRTPADGKLLESFPSKLPGNPRLPRAFLPLQKLTGITVAQFVEFFEQHPNDCINSPSFLELRDKGYQ